MKKLFALLLAMVMILGLAACNTPEPEATVDGTNGAAPEVTHGEEKPEAAGSV